MTKINNIKGRQVFDSRGNPTVEAEVFSDDGNSALSIVPSGASTGTHEAFELRDKDNKSYLNKSVFKAVENINIPIAKSLKNINTNDQVKIDNKSNCIMAFICRRNSERVIAKIAMKCLIKICFTSVFSPSLSLI